MEDQQPTSDQAVIQTLAIEKVNLEIENIRLKHELARYQQAERAGQESTVASV